MSDEIVHNLYEATRNQLIGKSKSSVKGIERFRRRTKSRIANSVREFNSIDMNKLFKDNILSVNIQVVGETNDYIVRISFGGFLDILHDELEKNDEVLDLKVIVKALITGFNKDDVYINCSCPDFGYRFSYWCTRNQFDTYALDNRQMKSPKLGVVDPQTIPSNITNPRDTLGSACKHVLLVLSNNSWIMKVASVINNYVKYMERHYQKSYADIIYPAIYQKPYEEPVQLTVFDKNRRYAKTGKDTLDKANVHDGRDEKGRFSQGNQFGQKFTPRPQDVEDEEELTLFSAEDEVID